MPLTELPLIGSDEPAPFEVLEGGLQAPVILVCDHASNRIPPRLGSLGVPAYRLDEHIAWDIGAGAVTRLLQQRLGADAVIAGYSRLVVDLNRNVRDTSALPQISDGVLIPGNMGLSLADRQARIEQLHAPYHAAVEQLVARHVDAGRAPVFLGIHSFTRRFHGTLRPWHAGILWDSDPRVAVPLLAALRTEPGLVIGDNEPYSGRHTADYTIDTHAESRGLAHAGIEIRQDLITDAAGQTAWADRLAMAIEGILLAPCETG